jgi:tripartite-type tricarboxylate transporter receptor subunit TctC
MRTPVLHAPFLARLWDYPTRPLTLIVPFAAGGTKADFAGRVANVRFRG